MPYFLSLADTAPTDNRKACDANETLWTKVNKFVLQSLKSNLTCFIKLQEMPYFSVSLAKGTLTGF